MTNEYQDPYMPDEEDKRPLCHTTSPWADSIESLEIYESKEP